MIRTFLTLAKIGLFLGAVVWVAEHPGTIEIKWLDYVLEFHIGFFLFVLFVLLVTGIFLFAVIKSIFDFPKTMERYHDMTGKDKGLKALSIGLSAVAAGDAKSASYQAYRVKKYLKDENPLSLLLEAQAARLQGDEAEASRAYIKLMGNENAGFMGVRGLLQSALDCGDYNGALELGHRALQDYPKQGWILSIVYDLEIRARNWDSASKILYRAEKAGAIIAEKALSDRVTMLLAQALENKKAGDEAGYFRDLHKAYKYNPKFLPTALWLSDMYIERGKHKAAVNMIGKAWKNAPHPELTRLWAKAYQPPKNNDSMARVRWFEKLLKLDPKSVEGLQAMASVMTQEGLWGDARRHLEMAEDIRPNVHLYKLWAELEEKATGDEEAVRFWLEKAADAPRERVWICSETGRVYDEWMPISDQGLFNTIIWDFSQGRSFALPHLQSARPIAGLITSAL
ncbi:MAG: heme biosynthesis protein HemY [Alphaproteobacteria bacterium]|nr:heme biosynthesis protein HemY [Alphaproteobacteria bacterium]